MIKYMGKSSLGLYMQLAFSDLVLAPFMPSNTQEVVVLFIQLLLIFLIFFESYPDKDPRKLGSYISWVAIATTCITSSMFLIALCSKFIRRFNYKSTGHAITWGEWAGVMLPLMIPLFLITPLVIYMGLSSNTKKASPEAPFWAAQELKTLGPVTFKEYLMAGIELLL